MESETVVQNQAQERTCPHCGLSGFASMQSVSKHAARCPERIRESRVANADNFTRPAREQVSAAETSLAAAEIICPACASKITNDGRTLVKQSPKWAALQRAEVNLSNLEAEHEKLQEENNALEKKREEDRKTPEQKLGEENEVLREKIRKLGGVPEERERRRFRFSERNDSKLENLEADNLRLKKQLQELETKDARKKAGTEEAAQEAPDRGSRIFHRQPRI